ncbi:hypothetical protein [Lysinibacillus xylanilyticus]|nr:hypothetical protein [Lysinibacillus xylanilyticus]
MRSEMLYDVLQPLSRAMELEKAAACKIQTAAPKGCLAFFKMSFTKGTL